MQKHYKWLRAKENKIPIGSGKISRRIIAYKKKKRKFRGPIVSHTEKINRFLGTGAKSDRAKKRIQFPSVAVKQIFTYWNRIKHPFVVHKLERNNTTSSAIELLEKTLHRKGITTADIIRAIDKCHALFVSNGFAYRRWYNKHRLKLNDFIRYSNSGYKNLPEGLRAQGVPKSWFNTCHKNSLDFLKHHFLVFGKDKYPEITEQIIKIWEEYKPDEELSEKEKLDLQQVSPIIYKFFLKNKDTMQLRDWSDVTGMLHNSLVMWKTLTPKAPFILKTERFWKREFPSEILRAKYGYSKQDINTDVV